MDDRLIVTSQEATPEPAEEGTEEATGQAEEGQTTDAPAEEGAEGEGASTEAPVEEEV
jgi:hypothetical protein